jgi:hypothetical protein
MLQIDEETFYKLMEPHQVAPHVFDPSKVEPGAPLPDMPKWDRTNVEKPVGDRSEDGTVNTYV